MGGTSTDVSRYAGVMEHVLESTTAGVTIQAPQLDINTVAAGGGSRLFYRGGVFVVGPESAGAHPGPVCYRKPGGCLAVTDANVVLGRVLPDYFPKIFGPSEDQPLDVEGACLKYNCHAQSAGCVAFVTHWLWWWPVEPLRVADGAPACRRPPVDGAGG
jgi:5-oxoprolinase (ATP-hydrolysing)